MKTQKHSRGFAGFAALALAMIITGGILGLTTDVNQVARSTGDGLRTVASAVGIIDPVVEKTEIAVFEEKNK